jgi:uncharacterized glyoxalase superfamily protein PhnB
MPIHPLLRCKNIKQTKNFYAEVLGFEASDGAEGSCTAAKEDCTLVFTESDLWAHAPHMSGTIYCFVRDVQEYYARMKDAVTLAWPLERMPYGIEEFGIVDCNGYTLAFAQAS